MFKKSFLAGFIAFSFVLSPIFASADTVSDIQAQINAILAQIKVLQAQLNAQTGVSNSSNTSAVSTSGVPAATSGVFCHAWNRSLRIGDQNDDVTNLVRALIKENLLSADEMFQDGRTVLNFDERVASAVVAFQEKYAADILKPNNLSHGTGFVGVSTRAKLNRLYGCGRTIQITEPTKEPSITVLSPNGGESWQKGTTQTIKWQDNRPVPVCQIDSTTGIGTCPTPRLYDIKLAPSYYPPFPPCTGQICPAYAYREPYFIAKGVNDSPYNWGVGKVISTYGSGETAPDGAYTVQVCQTGTNTCDSSDSYFKIVSQGTNLPPVVDGISGPPVLRIGESGTWSLKAHDPENSSLSYAVDCGDRAFSDGVGSLPSPTVAIQQNTSFIHSYAVAGTYTVKFTLTDNAGLTTQSSISVQVGNTTEPSITVLSPNGGESWQTGNTYTISYRLPSTDDSALVYLNNYHPVGSAKAGMENSSSLIAQPGRGVESVSYTVPSGMISLPVYQNSYKIKVCTVSDNCGSKTDISDSYFTITAPTSSNQPPTITPGRITINSGQPVTLNFANPSGVLDTAKLFLSCPSGITSSAGSSGVDRCNSWYTFPMLPSSSEFTFFNNTNEVKKVVPNYYIYYPSNPSYAVGGSSEIIVNPTTAFNADIKVNGSDNPVAIMSGTPFSISWSSVGTVRCNGYGYSEVRLVSDKRRWTDMFTLQPSGSDSFTNKITLPGNSFVLCVQCSDSLGKSVTDEIIVPISANTQPSITVLSPNGGEIITIGQNYTVQWNGTSLSKVRGELSVISQTTGTSYAISACCILLEPGSFNWPSVGAGSGETQAIPAGEYKLQVTLYPVQVNSDGSVTYTGGGYTGNLSDSPFTITAPTNTVTLSPGKDYFFRLPSASASLDSLRLRQNSDFVQGPNSSVSDKLIFSNPNGSTVTYFYSNIIGNNAWFDTTYTPIFTIPNEFLIVRKVTKEMVWSFPAGTYYYGSDAAANQKWYDDFKARYAQPTITVLSPNGGESWQIGTTQAVKWNSNLVSIPEKPITYDISLVPYCPAGQICVALAPFVIAKGVYGLVYDWKVGSAVSGSAPAGSYTVQVCQSGTTTCDGSDSYFKIIAAPMTDAEVIKKLEEAIRMYTCSSFNSAGCNSNFDLNSDGQVAAADELKMRSVLTQSDAQFDVIYKKIEAEFRARAGASKGTSLYLEAFDPNRSDTINIADWSLISKAMIGTRVYVPKPVLTDAEIITNLEKVVRNFAASTLSFKPEIHANFDLNDDKKVNATDEILIRNILTLSDGQFDIAYKKIMAAVEARMGLKTGDTNFLSEFDINQSGVIDYDDKVRISKAMIGTRVYPTVSVSTALQISQMASVLQSAKELLEQILLSITR